jgi:hypothetical protein
MKMRLSSLNLVKVGVCITSEENGETKLTSEENLFNNLLPKKIWNKFVTQSRTGLQIYEGRDDQLNRSGPMA